MLCDESSLPFATEHLSSNLIKVVLQIQCLLSLAVAGKTLPSCALLSLFVIQTVPLCSCIRRQLTGLLPPKY